MSLKKRIMILAATMLGVGYYYGSGYSRWG